MRRLQKTTSEAEGTAYMFECPGCGDYHLLNVEKPNGLGARWQFNGDLERPTFSPSLLVRSGHYASDHKGDRCWCTYNAENPDNPAPCSCYVCHSFIRDGRIEFLNDCTHPLAGQTVDLPEFQEGR